MKFDVNALPKDKSALVLCQSVSCLGIESPGRGMSERARVAEVQSLISPLLQDLLCGEPQESDLQIHNALTHE